MAREILIADSDKANQKEFQKIFETTDYHLIFSESGEDALLRTKLFKPDMIIASAGGLREMGGVEFCGAIKKEPDFKDIPFILVSNVYEEISEKDRQRVRADGVISIPLNEDEVLNLVDHLMEEVGKREEMVSGKSEFVLDEVGEGEEEIIELTDVVEEPEPKMSIDDLVASQKEEP
ncbi:MAG: response regulator, partial [Thermodesulfobacteriota bacterium]